MKAFSSTDVEMACLRRCRICSRARDCLIDLCVGAFILSGAPKEHDEDPDRQSQNDDRGMAARTVARTVDYSGVADAPSNRQAEGNSHAEQHRGQQNGA
jgi:hypothetical protein